MKVSEFERLAWEIAAGGMPLNTWMKRVLNEAAGCVPPAPKCRSKEPDRQPVNPFMGSVVDKRCERCKRLFPRGGARRDCAACAEGVV